MEGSRALKLRRDEEEGLTADEEDVCEEDSFNRTLVGKIWTDNPYNVRAFKNTMIQAWKVKHQIDIQDLEKKLFLFKFATKKEADSVLTNGPWSFDRNLVILDRISGEEQPSDLDMARVSFWVRIYDLPLKLRSEALAKKLGNYIGVFEEMDFKDQHRTGKFLRIRVSLDLRRPLKRGTKIKFQGRDLWVSFKYERLPNFCFVCGRIGHQMKDCEDIEDRDEDAYSELEEKDQEFGPWLRASPLPKFFDDVKKETSSRTCGKSLFSPSCGSKSQSVDKGKNTDEVVEQKRGEIEKESVSKVPVEPAISPDRHGIEEVAESLGTVVITTQLQNEDGKETPSSSRGRKWIRKKAPPAPKKTKQGPKTKGSGKRALVDVIITEGSIEEIQAAEKKSKGDVEMVACSVKNKEVVLDDQHHRSL